MLAAVAGLLLFAQASLAASIVWVGGEDLDFSPIGTGTAPDQTVGHFRSNWARGDLALDGGQTGGWPGAAWRANNIFSLTSLWAHARFYDPTTNTSNGGTIFALTTSDSVERIILGSVNGGGGCHVDSTGCTFVFKQTAAGVRTQLGSALTCSFSPAPSSPNALDINVTGYNVTNGGAISVYINGALCFSLTGTTIYTDAVTALNGVDLGPAQSFFASGYLTGWSEVIVTDTLDTRSMGLWTLAPNANGNTTAWTCNGSTPWQSVNPFTNLDATNCTSGTSSQVEEFAANTTPPTGAFGVLDFVTDARVNVGMSGPQHVEHMVRSGATDYSGGSIAPGLALGGTQTHWPTNPNTSAAWTTSQLNTAGFDIGINSQP